MTKKPLKKTDFRERLDFLKKKDKISDKKTLDLVEDMLTQINLLQQSVHWHEEEMNKLKNNPLVLAFIRLQERLDCVDHHMSDLDNKIERCNNTRHRLEEDDLH